MRQFIPSLIITLAALIGAYFWAGSEGLFVCGLLIILEVSFSFDNAVVNASVLRHMEKVWQRRFITIGMPISIIVMYYLFPIVIVACATNLSIADVTRMIIRAPGFYASRLNGAQAHISAFGGIFLLMVFLSFLTNEQKQLHWLVGIEKRLVRLGKLEAIEAVIALVILLVMQGYLPRAERLPVLVAGVSGIILYVLIYGITALFGVKKSGARAVTYSGLLGFIYLNLLDASFSLDAVIGSFAISRDMVIIVLGLSAGAMFVRSLTLHLVKTGMLQRYVYLEHGAHYGIGGLAIVMLVSLFTPVSEVVAGLTGSVFILLSFMSSVRYNKAGRKP